VHESRTGSGTGPDLEKCYPTAAGVVVTLPSSVVSSQWVRQMKTFFSFWLALMVISFGVWAGAVYTNDTGQAVYGIRVEFAEAVKITSHAEKFPIQSPEGAASAFIFSGSEALPGEMFWLSWSPASVGVLQYEWLTDAARTAAGIATVSPVVSEQHIVQDEYKVQFVDAHGQSIEVDVLREKSREAIPFTVSYHLEFPDAYKVVAIVDDPGLFSFPDKDGDLASVVVPTLKIDDFNDTDKVSELGTTWTFQHTDSRIAAFEVARTAYGYGLMFDGNNGASLDLNGLDVSDSEGLYLLITAEFSVIPTLRLEIDLDQSFRSITFHTSDAQPVLRRFPFADFRGLGLSDLESLALSLTGSFPPFWGITLYNAGLYTTLDKLVEKVDPSTAFDLACVFRTNSREHTIRFVIVDESGNLFTYQESVDFPLHTETEILLDAEQAFAGEELASATWHLSNVDPTESADIGGMRVSYQSSWPDVRDVNVRAIAKSGEVLEKRFYALIYWKDGCPIPRRGFQAITPFIYPSAQFDAVKEKLELAKALGYNMMSYQIFWHYGWPDENGNFTLSLIPGDHVRQDRSKGWTLSDDGLRNFLGAANEVGLRIGVQLLQFPYVNDPALNREYDAAGWASDGGCFRCDEHFLYGNGEGYWDQLMHYKDLVDELGVDVVLFGAEIVAMEMGYYPKTRKFYSDAAREWKDSSSKTSYAVLDWSPEHLGFNTYNMRTNWQVLNPSISSIPFEDLDLVALNEYQVLASRADSSVDEMYGRAVSRISGYMKEFHEAYDKPLFIGDLVIAAYEDVLLGPPEDQEKMVNGARDDIAQVKYYLAWLRAFSHAIKDLDYDWIYGVTIGSFQMIPDQQFLATERVGSVSGGMKVPEGNLKPRLLDTFEVYLSDKPIED